MRQRWIYFDYEPVTYIHVHAYHDELAVTYVVGFGGIAPKRPVHSMTKHFIDLLPASLDLNNVILYAVLYIFRCVLIIASQAPINP